jgi:hypothetical protein
MSFRAIGELRRSATEPTVERLAAAYRDAGGCEEERSQPAEQHIPGRELGQGRQVAAGHRLRTHTHATHYLPLNKPPSRPRSSELATLFATWR